MATVYQIVFSKQKSEHYMIIHMQQWEIKLKQNMMTFVTLHVAKPFISYRISGYTGLS